MKEIEALRYPSGDPSGGGDDGEEEFAETPEQRRGKILSEAQERIKRTLGSIQEQLSAVDADITKALHSPPHLMFHFIYECFSPESRAEAQVLTLEIQQIVHEKGFRYTPSIDTPSEHASVGSTISSYFKNEDPLIPLPLLEHKMLTEGKITSADIGGKTLMGFEEIDKARRLAGRTTLDPATQRITADVDQAAATDSYHFLSSERKLAIQKRESEISARMHELAQQSLQRYEQIKTLRDHLEKYVDGALTSPEMNAAVKVEQDAMSDFVKHRAELDLDGLIRDAKTLSFETGKRDKILTPQEIKLRIGGIVPPPYEASPYRPLAVQDGVSPEEVTKLRQSEAVMVVTNEGIMAFAYPWAFKLEDLDINGDTKQGPTIVNSAVDHTPMDVSRIMKEINKDMIVPFARPMDPYYKKQ